MLIGRPEGFDRRLAGVKVFLVQPVFLAETFRPQLAKPIAERIEESEPLDIQGLGYAKCCPDSESCAGSASSPRDYSGPSYSSGARDQG